MATSTTGDDSWKTGLIIVAAMLVVGAAIGGGIYAADVPGGDPTTYLAIVGGIVGAALGFVGASYVMYGR